MESRVHQGLSRLAELEEQEQRLRTRQGHLDNQVCFNTSVVDLPNEGYTTLSDSISTGTLLHMVVTGLN
jgi:hypothetical protein